MASMMMTSVIGMVLVTMTFVFVTFARGVGLVTMASMLMTSVMGMGLGTMTSVFTISVMGVGLVTMLFMDVGLRGTAITASFLLASTAATARRLHHACLLQFFVAACAHGRDQQALLDEGLYDETSCLRFKFFNIITIDRRC